MTGWIADPAHLLRTLRIALLRGGTYLVSRIAPNGPILRERNVSYVHKTSWGMYSAGIDHAVIARLLDWARDEALRPQGDFYFPEEGPEYQQYQRLYRPLNFLRVAAWIGHPLAENRQVIERILQYQHASGGVFHYLGDDPQRPEPPPTIGVLNTTFFGHLMIALDQRERALAAGNWVRSWVQSNRPHMEQGRLFTQVAPDGQLVTDVPDEQRIGMMVDRQSPKQEFWQVGTAMAYLAFLYDTMCSVWRQPAAEARPLLDAALVLLEFEAAMPLETYLWPSKCKVGWGAGELLRVLCRHGLGDTALREKAYSVAARVGIFTFLDNQLADGGWPHMHYPLRNNIPELAFSYKPLGNVVAVPPDRIEGSQTIYLPREEITGEFLGEMKAIEQGVAAWLEAT